ncbi:MAG: hypothetical protein HeimC2_35390 [Candidatus Heimdallarchaeota archaeon LC_2]|nr:MAG: hypothetical protein HeimC2_35390 [Candidatus Heimdallarchaeota archaeon LC_2]
MESLLELDEKIIVKLDKYFPGNIFIDDGMVAICKVGSYLVELDISGRTKTDLSLLYELFEDEWAEVYGQIIEFYDYEDSYSIAEDIMKSISDKKVRRYCDRITKQIEDESDLEIKIELLNKLSEDCKLSLEELPQLEEDCIYHTSRNLFYVRGRKSRTNETIRRFTVAKHVLEFLQQGHKYTVRLEFSNKSNAPKVNFHVSEGTFDRDILYSKRKPPFSNGDNSLRLNTPKILLERLWNDNNEFEVFIRLIENEIEFLLCE